LSEAEGVPKKYEVSVQAMDEQCTKASGDYDDLTQMGEMDTEGIAALLDKFHRLPYPQPELPDDHCQPQILVSRDDQWLSFIHDGGRLLECQTDTHVNSEEGAALVARYFASIKPREKIWHSLKFSGKVGRVIDFFRTVR
jgi:hypothetical protein